MNFEELVSFFLGLPKTVYINFKYLPFKDAVKLPIWISHHVWLLKLRGKINIEAPIKFGMIRIGFGGVGIFDRKKSRTILEINGMITFKGKTEIGHGSKLSIAGELVLGKNFIITAETSIICFKKIVIGDDCLFSWECLIMDTDFHTIKNLENKILNEDKEIVFGNKVWMGCRCTILKGTKVEDEVVIAANSCVNSAIKGSNLIVAGNPAKVVKDKITWSP